MYYFCGQAKQKAQVAELVDALVSNTNGVIRAGSSPALGTKKLSLLGELFLFYYVCQSIK